jgi:hypothetical protein
MYVRRRNFSLQQRVTYEDFDDYLTRRFLARYTKIKPSCSAVVSAGDPELGAVLQWCIEGVVGAAKKTPGLTLHDYSAAPCAAPGAPAAPGPAAPAAADEGCEDAAHKVSSRQCT